MIAYEEVMNDEPQQDNSKQECYFGGFAPPDENNYFSVLQDWKIIGASINNLAEYKIVDYLLQITWGNGDPYARIPLTIESLMHGDVDEYGERIDDGTGLSKQSVVTGIEKAIKHGLIEREIEYWTDEEGRTRSTRYYGLHFYAPAEVNNLDFDNFPQESTVNDLDSGTDQIGQVNDLDFRAEMALEADCVDSQKVEPSTNSYYPSIDIITDRKVIRIHKRQKVNEPGGKQKYPAFIKSYIEELSHNFGDKEHTGSNIAQTTNIYKQSGLNEEEFTQYLSESKEITRGKVIRKMNSRKWPNRMPFFFGCLKKLLTKQGENTNGQ